ncbi:MAG: extracellular solute-binding protein, partial [Lachnospiraceae bacterium]|nr:extracellular solute-binding protein [Lachnospiraceae bacterium]
AIGAFQQQNPNVRIDFRIASEGAASANTEDIIRTLNTELLNGDGPDILLLDGLPVNSYMEKGVLADLTDGITTMAEGGVLENIAGAYEYEGHCYGIPSRFTIPAMAGEQSALGSVKSLEDLADFTENSGDGGAPFLTPSNNLYGEEGMMMDYYEDCSSDLVESGKIDEAALTKYFTDMLRIQKAQESNFMETDIGVVDGKVVLFELMGFMESDEDLFYVQEIKGYNATNVILSDLSGSGMSPEHALMPVFGEFFYTPRQAVGITSASKQQELALQFVNLLLSQTVQDVYLYDGFPVNSRSLDKLVDNAVKNKENSTKFREMCGQLNTPIFVDQVVREAVQSQMKGLLDGTLTAESAAAAVMEKIELYLKE